MSLQITKIEAHIYANALHNEQVLAYAKLWAEKNNCAFSINYLPADVKNYGPTTIKLLVNDKVLLIDNSDAPALVTNGNVHTYFKRSFIPSSINTGMHAPVYPLGFNYAVTYQPFSLNRIKSLSADKVYIFRSLPVLNLFSNYCFNNIHYNKMHGPPTDNGGNILMVTRLWDPANVNSPQKKEFREHMNAMRIEVVKMLKQAFPGKAVCGIAGGQLAQKICPELIVSQKLSGKKNYLARLRSADICIATSGLENTLGWRIGEYVAFSKAVVTEKFDVVVPGFNENEHYVSFDKENIKDRIDALLYQKNYTKMQQANHKYYNDYLSPLAYFERILKLAGILN